jgi:hypothetical protein
MAFLPITDEELLAIDLPPTAWASYGFVPFPGLVAVSGRPGSFKTFFSLFMARKIALGEATFSDISVPVGHNETGKASPVLFIEDENSMNLMKERMELMRGGSPVGGLYYAIQDGFKISDDAAREEIIGFCVDKGIKVVFMDPFSSVAGVADENSNAEVSRVMDLLRLEFVKRDISVVFIHHPSKGDDGGTNLRGAGDILGKCDVHVSLEREDPDDNENTNIVVKFAKMRIADNSKFDHFRMKYQDGEFVYLGTLKSSKQSSAEKMRGSVMLALMDGEASAVELGDRIGVNPKSDGFRRCLRELQDSGVIERTGTGPGTKYRLVPTVGK